MVSDCQSVAVAVGGGWIDGLIAHDPKEEENKGGECEHMWGGRGRCISHASRHGEINRIPLMRFLCCLYLHIHRTAPHRSSTSGCTNLFEPQSQSPSPASKRKTNSPVIVEKRRVSAALVLREDVDLRLELLVSLDRAGGREHLTPSDVVSLDTSQ